MESSPKVTICIPTFDRLGYLREAVASARVQTLRDIEILIADDGDSAELESWCRAQVAEDVRVRYEKTPTRLRLAGNWNFLASLAKGEYLTLMGDDDRLLPTFAERLLNETRDEIAVAFSNHYIIDSAGHRLMAESHAATRHYGREGLRGGTARNAQDLVWRNSVPMMAALVRSKDVRRLGFKHDINSPELELFVRMASEGARFAFVAEYLAEYRVHAGSETSQGLTIDRLAEYLQEVDVPIDVEPVKRTCLSQMLVAGVGIRLKRGDVGGARSLRASRYYPSPAIDLRVWLQGMILRLPDALAPPLYQCLIRAKSLALLGKGWGN